MKYWLQKQYSHLLCILNSVNHKKEVLVKSKYDIFYFPAYC